MPLIANLVKQESHRAGVGNHEADGVDQEWTRNKSRNGGCREKRSTSA